MLVIFGGQKIRNMENIDFKKLKHLQNLEN